MIMEDTRNSLIRTMKEYFGEDDRRISHALEVLSLAERIQKVEGGKLKIVEAAAILHNIKIPESERKYNSSAGRYQEIEGPPVAERILRNFGFSEEEIDHICRIIANHHSDKGIDSVEFRIVWDADWLVNIPDEFDLADREKIKKIVDEVFKTAEGAVLAGKFIEMEV